MKVSDKTAERTQRKKKPAGKMRYGVLGLVEIPFLYMDLDI
jgi:hypothetical protein